ELVHQAAVVWREVDAHGGATGLQLADLLVASDGEQVGRHVAALEEVSPELDGSYSFGRGEHACAAGLVEDGAAVGEQQPTEVLGDLETGDAALHQPVDVGATVAVGVARQRFRRSPQLGERGGWLDA